MKEKMKPRIISSREGLQAVVADVVAAKLQHADLTVQMESGVAAVQARFQEPMAALARQIEWDEAAAQVWAERNKAEFGERKNLDLVMATVGFETTPHRVEMVNSKDKWGKVARRMEALDWAEDYLRQPDQEVNKQRLLTDRTKLTRQQLAEAGIEFAQDENFFIRPKSQVLQPSVKEAA
jgi:phage host-nuclease inhibitor protein Gam